MRLATYINSELYIMSSQAARFSWEGREYEGKPKLNAALLERLRESELQPSVYGDELFRALFPSKGSLREGFREAMASAQRAKKHLRFRLHIAPRVSAVLHALYWELLLDADRQVAIGRSPDTALSRYSTVSHPLGKPISKRPRLLWLVSTPTNASAYGIAEINRSESSSRLTKSFRALESQMEIEFLDPPATPNRLRQRLVSGDYHVLHIFGHGLIRRGGKSCLVLEDKDSTALFVDESVLGEIFLGNRDLRLVSLIACHGGALSSSDNFSGLAGRLVERGLPAVIAMRRAVTIDMAHVFSEHLYRELARAGRVDVAINEARHHLFLEKPGSLAWSIPMLFMRLRDGMLWSIGKCNQVDCQHIIEPSGLLPPETRDKRLLPAQSSSKILSLLKTYRQSILEKPLVSGLLFNGEYHVEPSDLLRVYLREILFTSDKPNSHIGK